MNWPNLFILHHPYYKYGTGRAMKNPRKISVTVLDNIIIIYRKIKRIRTDLGMKGLKLRCWNVAVTIFEVHN
jgi:hypothetical protein